VVKGAIRAAKGHLGAFELTVDDYAQPAPSSRGVFAFGAAKNGRCRIGDIVLDLSGGAPLFSAADLRDGYLRADPGDPAAVLKAVLRARDLVGTFDKPRYVTFTEGICAHSRSGIVAAIVASIYGPTAPLYPLAITSRSTPIFAPDGGNAPRSANRGCVLCTAAGRRAYAQATRTAHHLSRSGRRTRDRAAAR